MEFDLRPEKIFATVFALFSILAIFIATIGIVGLVLITISNNMKELGVRKALGAQWVDLSKLLSKQLSWQLIGAVVLAIPLSYYGYETWFLGGYIHRIGLSWWLFAAPVFLMLTSVSGVVLILSLYVSKLKTTEILQYE